MYHGNHKRVKNVNNALPSTIIMFKNNISKEFCQQIDKKYVIIYQNVRASEEKNEKGQIFGILRLFRKKMLSKKKQKRVSPPLGGLDVYLSSEGGEGFNFARM